MSKTEEMSGELFTYLMEYVKIFADSELQERLWPSIEANESEDNGGSGTCEDFLAEAIDEWEFIRGRLEYGSYRLENLVKKVDQLCHDLTVFLDKIPAFKEERISWLNSRIRNDFLWQKIGRDSMEILKLAEEILEY